MCCLNGSRKLHFVQKIHPDTQAYNDIVEANFLRSNFLQVLNLLIFRQLARLLMPVPLPFSPSFISYILFAKWQWNLRSCYSISRNGCSKKGSRSSRCNSLAQ
jgi:hypothetical protein